MEGLWPCRCSRQQDVFIVPKATLLFMLCRHQAWPASSCSLLLTNCTCWWEVKGDGSSQDEQIFFSRFVQVTVCKSTFSLHSFEEFNLRKKFFSQMNIIFVLTGLMSISVFIYGSYSAPTSYQLKRGCFTVGQSRINTASMCTIYGCGHFVPNITRNEWTAYTWHLINMIPLSVAIICVDEQKYIELHGNRFGFQVQCWGNVEKIHQGFKQ